MKVQKIKKQIGISIIILISFIFEKTFINGQEISQNQKLEIVGQFRLFFDHPTEGIYIMNDKNLKAENMTLGKDYQVFSVKGNVEHIHNDGLYFWTDDDSTEILVKFYKAIATGYKLFLLCTAKKIILESNTKLPIKKSTNQMFFRCLHLCLNLID